ncbi:MAG: hypothetical protein KC506_03420, partial [Nanoarchaeota archaeon]|nr:hypothetical protein [Nanoarchaeota archaeon]
TGEPRILRVGTKGRVTLPEDIVETLRKRNSQTPPLFKDSLYMHPLKTGQIECLPYSELISLDPDYATSEETYNQMSVFFSTTHSTKIDSKRRIPLPDEFKGLKQIVLQPDKEIFTSTAQ